MVLRRDDCITYHLVCCRAEGATHREMCKAFSVAPLVGGSIVIPRLRRAVATLDKLPKS